MNLNDLYSEKVLDHFKNPRNMGEIPNADGVSTVGNPVCGDIMRMFIKVGRRPVLNRKHATTETRNDMENTEEYVEDIKFQTLGCGAAIATSSMATEMIKEKTLEEALKITNKAVAEALGGLPPVKMHCSVLAEEAVQSAIEAYKKKKSSVK
ncbi:MAG: iron-sulfur cluster assembly scaffold protein [bacterium]|nr:iron-sulfur cluster assembly scaffold protein [bacterium]